MERQGDPFLLILIIIEFNSPTLLSKYVAVCDVRLERTSFEKYEKFAEFVIWSSYEYKL